MMRPTPNDRSVLIFHGIGTPGRVLEPGEDRYWLSRDAFCDILDRVVAMGDDAPEITFDDGNASDHAIALPELVAYGLTATFFLLTARLDMPGSLSSEEVRDLARNGQRIGLHGHAHRDWRALSAAECLEEYRTARARLSDLAGAEIAEAAAPFGYYDRRVLRRLAAEGFTALYTSDYGRAAPGAFLRPRNCLTRDMSVAKIDRLLTGTIPLRRRPRRMLGLARKRLLPLGVGA